MNATYNLRIFRVGGFVRDRLLGLEPKDCDFVVVGATPEEMLTRGFSLVGAEFGVFLHPDTKDEFALARTERKTAPGHKGFSVHASPEVTLEDDLSRRDLTINAMAMDDTGTLTDPFNGQADLNARVLRHVSEAFTEDPLRVLRVARFAARLGFTVAPETMSLMRAIVVSGELETLSPERVLAEMKKACTEHNPARFFEVLRECGALACVLPEVDALFGVPQPELHHPEVDTGIHTLMVLNQASRMGADFTTCVAVLLHDLGKGQTPKEILPKHHGHEIAGVPLVEAVCSRLKMSAITRKLAVNVARFHTHCHRAGELRPGTIVKLFHNLDAFRQPEGFECFLVACEADSRGRAGLEGKPYPQADLLRQARHAAASVSTRDLIDKGLEGPAFGEALKQRRVAAVRAVLAISQTH